MRLRARTFMAIAASAAIAASGCAAPPAERGEIVPTDTTRAEPPANAAILPANTHMTVTLDAPLDPATVRVGTPFTVSVVEPIVARNGATVVPEGTVITGMVTGVDQSTGPDDLGAIRLNFLRMNLNGVNHPFSAAILATSLYTPDAGTQPDQSPTDVPRGAIVRGEVRDTLVEGEMGVGAGSIISLGTGTDATTLPEGTRLTIRNFDNIDLRP